MPRRRPLDLLRERITALPDVDPAPSQFGHEEAFWVNGTEVAHFEDEEVEVRLTRELIRDNRPALRADPRVTLRRHASDWLSIAVYDRDDVDAAMHWLELAAARHRASPGEPARLPPTPRALARRRRFH